MAGDSRVGNDLNMDDGEKFDPQGRSITLKLGLDKCPPHHPLP